MNIAVLGTGMVGNTIATKLAQIGQPVMMGSRSATGEAAREWLRSAGSGGRCGTFAEAAAFGELVFNCTSGANSLAALRLAGAANLRGKILIDVANPLDASPGMPPTLTVCNTDSLGEQIQREFPDTRVVKALNTLNCEVMVNPSLVPGDHHLFICGNDAAARKETGACLCRWFGWKPENLIELGDITAARGTEMFLPFWLRLYAALGSPRFNIRVVVPKS
jgi:predicted dinucleotide-binding enzyme